MSYNFTRRVLRAEKKLFVKQFKKKNNVTDQTIATILKVKNKKMSLENQYVLFLEIQIKEMEAELKNRERYHGEEVINGSSQETNS